MANNYIMTTTLDPIVPQSTYEDSVCELLDLAQRIEQAKRPGYTQDSNNVLSNFKNAAEMNGITSMQAWGTYFYKHVAAILSYAKNPDIPQAEPFDSRFADAINYLKLGFHMIKEREIEQEFKNQKLPF